MKKALIDPSAVVFQLTQWVWNSTSKKYEGVWEEIPNSNRVAEVADSQFPVASPLFWVECADDVVADAWYYDKVTQTIVLVPPPPPVPPIPEA
jgi:hypothetical protein